MTNEEAIRYLSQMYLIQFDSKEHESLTMAINSIQENAKLKAEIKRLNGKSEMYRDMADSFCNSNIKLKAEIEQLKENYDTLAKQYTNVENSSITYYNELKQLKSELEQSIKEKSEIISKIEYALNECEPIYNKCAAVPQAKPIYDLAMNYCLDLLKGQV